MTMLTYDYIRRFGLLRTIWRVEYKWEAGGPVLESATLVNVSPEAWPNDNDNEYRYVGDYVGTLGIVPKDMLGEKFWTLIAEGLSEDILIEERLISEVTDDYLTRGSA